MPNVTALSREEVLESIRDLPPFSQVATRVLRMAQDPNTSAADLARAISRDQALTSMLIRASNAVSMGGSQPISSLSQAIVRLGLRTVRDMVVVSCLPNGHPKSSELIHRSLWAHSVGSALACRMVAALSGEVDPEDAFLAGLFHDVGKLHLNQCYPSQFRSIWDEVQGGLDSNEAEDKIFGIDHCEIGAEILKSWGLGEELVECCTHHHRSPAVLETMCLQVAAADEMLPCPLMTSEGEDIEVRFPETSGSACDRLGLSEGGMEVFADRVRATVEKEIRYFSSAT